MKTYSKLLALCVFQYGVWGAASFMVQQAPPNKAHKSTALNERKVMEKVMERVNRGSPYNGGASTQWWDRPQAGTQWQDRPRERTTSAPLIRRKDIDDKSRWFDRSDNRGNEWWDRPTEPWFRQQGSSSLRYDRPNRGPSSVEPWYRQPQESQRRGPPFGPSSAMIQGGSRQSLSSDGRHDSVQVQLRNEGRPMDAEVEVWEGPNNIPQSLKVYSEDGYYRPFNALFKTPGYSHTVDVKNAGTLEFPFTAAVRGGGERPVSNTYGSETIQGGDTLKTYNFGPYVESVQVDLFTEGLPMEAIIELWEGPNCIKQVAEVYADNGRDRSFSAVIDTPAYGNTIAVRNIGPLEYPIEASVSPL